MNSIYPHWLTAHIIIPNLVDKHFDVLITGNTTGSCSISFLGEDAVYMVPPEDQEAFNGQYTEFARWINGIIDLPTIFDSYSNVPMGNGTFDAMRNDIYRMIQDWEAQNRYEIKQCMKNILLGFEPISAITNIQIAIE